MSDLESLGRAPQDGRHGAGEGLNLSPEAVARLETLDDLIFPAIDGDFGDWDANELTQLGTLMLEDPGQLRYRRRERRGTHDFSGAVRFMWDERHLYVRADVMDDTLRAPVAGKKLFEGDHLGLWLDMDLARAPIQSGRHLSSHPPQNPAKVLGCGRD